MNKHKRDLLQEGLRRLRLETRGVAEAWVLRRLEEMVESGEVAREAERRGISYGRALTALGEALWRPFAEVRGEEAARAKARRERMATRPATKDEQAPTGMGDHARILAALRERGLGREHYEAVAGELAAKGEIRREG